MFVDWLKMHQPEIAHNYVLVRREQGDIRSPEEIQQGGQIILTTLINTLGNRDKWEAQVKHIAANARNTGTPIQAIIHAARGTFLAIKHTLEQEKNSEGPAWLIEISDYMLIGSQAASQVLNEHLERQQNTNQEQLAALLEAQGVLKAIYEHNANGIVILDSAGFVRGVNPAALNLLKVDTSSPYLNVPLTSYNITWNLYLVDGTLVTMETYPLTRALRGEIIVDEIERVVRWDNSERWISTNASPIYNTDNTIMGATIIFTDITDSYLATQKLESNRDLTSAIVSQSPVPTMVIKLPALTTELINDAAKELLGIQNEPDREDVPIPEILKTKSWVDLNPDGTHVEPADLPLAQALRGKKVLNRELWIRRKDNTERWALFNGIPLYDTTGKQIAAMLIFPDITPAKHAEDQLNDWKQRYEMVTQSAEQVVYDYDIPNDYLSWNNVTQTLLGFDPAELNGPINKWVELIHPDDMAETMRQFEESERRISTFDVEYRFRRKDGRYLWVHDRGLYFAGADHKAIRMVGVMQDITRHKLADQEQARLQQEIIDAQQQTLKDLATPIIPIMDQILVMPIIGTIDTRRARDITRALLIGITQYRAKVVIFDITGVPLVDSGVATYLNKTIQAARLKGARTIVTGISDAVAETIVDLGIDWSNIETLRDLQSGLVAALESLGIQLTSKP